MIELDREKTIEVLNRIMEYELAGVVRYTHYSLMVTGPHRIPIVQFFQQQATESLTHTQQVGEILTGLEGHPSLKVAPIEESYEHNLHSILTESYNHEKQALELYKELLDVVKDASVYLEEFARGMIGQEEIHQLELKKMLRDFV
ncbi:Ferritin Dps family protein [Gloeothece citriformis PCC 7424]|uniref:Ferritin Dps family protein n=1 Tax=Gloeothece citriformis (strain PCC 7424) TaxID=65393 RepID=B7KI37_GLOC7|nr:ferritin-like domain-containing protein [Gloeothece citriformis]ACK73524.1 Ferritin Dps family protein [Gloeothece citriformis PCC 7424]